MAPTPSGKSNQTAQTPSIKSNQTHSKAPQSRQRLNFNVAKPSPNNTHSAARETHPSEHPVEVISRIRDYPDRKEKPVSALQINQDRQSLRVGTDIGYRDFSLDGISVSEEEDLDSFYKKFIASRISDVKLGAKCTIMMYGPTGSGKSHTMFGCAKQPGIVYRSLKDILRGEGEEDEEVETNEERVSSRIFVQVAVLEIYNEEIYDLLSTNNGGGGFSLGWSKGCSSKVRLEVMGKKAKNATYISGTEAGKISKEILKVEKRRIVKSTFCNDTSSRSHCMIILDVPTVGGRLMLVDMAGSENIEQAGQVGFEAKMQTAKINQGNTALKRVVESIANGDSHIPFRDSKLTMLLQDSFEDDKSKILMILCASPDPKEMHKTISTLEYGSKAKCIVRGPYTAEKKDRNGNNDDAESMGNLGSRIVAMDQFILKLQMENQLKEKERNEVQKQLIKKEEEISALRMVSEEMIKTRINERTEMLKGELEKKMQECQQMANELVELERRKMEDRMVMQQKEVELMRSRLQEIELEVVVGSSSDGTSAFAKRLQEICSDPSSSSCMEKSMDLSMSMDMETTTGKADIFCLSGAYNDKRSSFLSVIEEEEGRDDEEEEEEEVQKEVVTIHSIKPPTTTLDYNLREKSEEKERRLTIQNIFSLCGNYREVLSQQQQEHNNMIEVAAVGDDDFSNNNNNSKENKNPYSSSSIGDLVDVYVKWEVSMRDQQHAGKFITTLKVTRNATLADLRKQIEMHLLLVGASDKKQQQSFTFLVLGDPTGAPVDREKEATVQASKLPVCNEGHLACLRPTKGAIIHHQGVSNYHHLLPLSPINVDNNKINGSYSL
ncbi:kinesin-like protein KIN-10A [Impatiens glandulifera]|uniref:kinesin-like protein KIN-10A n=1 Tax=Impatiens glandulifera TaxID=253017 RepID=UPI001FB11DAC|nr:kinesin-like protein KIN-10A [Impatiens glandulifera]